MKNILKMWYFVLIIGQIITVSRHVEERQCVYENLNFKDKFCNFEQHKSN